MSGMTVCQNRLEASATDGVNRNLRKDAADGSSHSLNDRDRDADVFAMNEADRALALRAGYTPVFKRDFGYLSTFSFALAIGSLYSSVATTFIYPLQAGGSAAIVWCTWCPRKRIPDDLLIIALSQAG
jgi:hypothetical protein